MDRVHFSRCQSSNCLCVLRPSRSCCHFRLAEINRRDTFSLSSEAAKELESTTLFFFDLLAWRNSYRAQVEISCLNAFMLPGAYKPNRMDCAPTSQTISTNIRLSPMNLYSLNPVMFASMRQETVYRHDDGRPTSKIRPNQSAPSNLPHLPS